MLLAVLAIVGFFMAIGFIGRLYTAFRAPRSHPSSNPQSIHSRSFQTLDPNQGGHEWR